MRRPLLPLVAGALALLAACGSGQSPVVEGEAGPAGSSTTALVAAGDPSPAVPGDAGTTVVPGAAGGDGAPADVVDPAADPVGGGDGEGGEPVDPSLPFPPPAAGRYTFRTTGTAPGGLLGAAQPVDEETVTEVVAVSADTVRQVASSPQGDQTTELRYKSGRVALLSLDLGFGPDQRFRFASAAGEQFAPVPPSAGQTWSWTLTDDSRQLTIRFDGTTQPAEAITVLGAPVTAFVVDATITVSGTYAGFPVAATIQIRSWVDPALRTSVRVHQVSTITQPVQGTSDTTSELTSVTPA